jgi:hypothetical protein
LLLLDGSNSAPDRTIDRTFGARPLTPPTSHQKPDRRATLDVLDRTPADTQTHGVGA